MLLTKKRNNRFNVVVDNVRKTSEEVHCTGASVLIIHDDKIVTEEYWGKHSKDFNARPIQGDTQFHVASVRKSYIGFAVAFAITEGYIHSIDDLVTKYLPLNKENMPDLGVTTIRHLLTHTHGLKKINGQVFREFPVGQSWAYRGIGIEILTQVVKNITNKTIAEIVTDKVLKPLHLTETGWYGQVNEKLVDVVRKSSDPNWTTYESTEGDKMNMYVSTRDLAKWGYFHLKQGYVNGQQVIAKELINLATSLQSPSSLDTNLPQNGFLWFVKDLPANRTEIGDRVPKGSYQLLGYTGVTLLVIPSHDLVAVRAFNSFGSPEGFDYLADVRKFGDTIMRCLDK